MNKTKLYKEICRMNKAYETIVNREEDDYLTDDLCDISGEMYELLVKIQNNWETIITAQ